MDITAVRDAMAAAVRTTCGIQAFAYRPSTITPPTWSIEEYDLFPHQAFGSLVQIDFKAHLFVARADDQAALRTVDSFIAASAQSIQSAIETDKTLGGAAHTLVMQGISRVGAIFAPVNDVEYVGAEFTIRVWG